MLITRKWKRIHKVYNLLKEARTTIGVIIIGAQLLRKWFLSKLLHHSKREGHGKGRRWLLEGRKNSWKHGVPGWQAVTGRSRPRAAHTPVPCLYCQNSLPVLVPSPKALLQVSYLVSSRNKMDLLYIRLYVNSSWRSLHVQALFVASKRVLATVLNTGQEVRSPSWLWFRTGCHITTVEMDVLLKSWTSVKNDIALRNDRDLGLNEKL